MIIPKKHETHSAAEPPGIASDAARTWMAQPGSHLGKTAGRNPYDRFASWTPVQTRKRNGVETNLNRLQQTSETVFLLSFVKLIEQKAARMITATTDPMTLYKVTDIDRAPYVVEGTGPHALKIYYVRSIDCGPMPGFIVSQSSHRDSTADHCDSIRRDAVRHSQMKRRNNHA